MGAIIKAQFMSPYFYYFEQGSRISMIKSLDLKMTFLLLTCIVVFVLVYDDLGYSAAEKEWCSQSRPFLPMALCSRHFSE